jgi:hypothetical protein
MPGRLRTASRPSRTVKCLAVYPSATAPRFGDLARAESALPGPVVACTVVAGTVLADPVAAETVLTAVTRSSLGDNGRAGSYPLNGRPSAAYRQISWPGKVAGATTPHGRLT